jgi:hypothetical protein
LFQRVDLNPFQGWYDTCLQNIAATFQAVGLGNLAVPGQCRFNRIDDSHGGVTQVTNGGSSIYHALQASFTKRLSRTKNFGDFTFTTAYTWSHLIDNASEIFGPGFRTLRPGDIQAGSTAGGMINVIPIGLLFDPQANAPVESITPLAQTYNSTTGAERGNSSFDRRHRFVTSFLWEPFPTHSEWLRGWQLNGIFTYQSGQPFSPLNAAPFSACADANGDGNVSNDRPDIGNAGAPLKSVALLNDPFCLDPTLGYHDLQGNPINPSSAHFVQRPLYASSTIPGLTLSGAPPVSPTGVAYAGTAGRNSLVGPRTVNLDLSLFKNIRIKERYTLQFRWEVYDLLNHPNPGYFNGNPYISDASGAPAFAYAATRTGAAITGGLPENAIDAVDNVTGTRTFLSKNTMNTSSRRMQFGLRLIF